MLIYGLTAIVIMIWLGGIPWFWHLQSKSRDIVNVNPIDRLMTLVWLPLYCCTIIGIGIFRIYDRLR